MLFLAIFGNPDYLKSYLIYKKLWYESKYNILYRYKEFQFYQESHLSCFWPFLAIFGHFWVPRVLENFPNGYLTLKYIKIYHFTPILGLQLSPESHFTQLGPICAILGCFWPFLDTQSSWKFSKWLPNIEIHQDITFYTYFGGYNCLQYLICAVLGCF